MEFENAEDLQYYVEEDPAHRAFVGKVKALVKGAAVMDFTPHQF